MKQFRVNEDGKDVWIQQWDERSKFWDIIEDSSVYSGYFCYFTELMEIIGYLLEDIKLVLNVTEESTLLTLYLKDEQLPLAEEIKLKLLEAFPEDIEQIGIAGNELNIMDIFYEYNG